MAIWDKVRQELDRAGKAAQQALDEGKVRLEAMRARQQADKAAQALGYAVYRARQQQSDIDTDAYARLSSALASAEAEAKRLEDRLDELVRSRKGGASADASARSATDSADAPEAPHTPGPTTPYGGAPTENTQGAPPPDSPL